MELSLFDKSVACFDEYHPDTFRSLHHPEFMFIRELQFLDLDEQCEIINQQVKDNPNFHPFRLRNVQLIHENHYAMEIRWEENEEIVTNLTLKKDSQYWRSMVSRIPKEDASKLKL